MNESTAPYQHGSFYEIFMCRANQSHDNSKPGIHGSTMENLINAENGDTALRKFIGSYEKQLEQVKKYMNKSMDKYLKMKKLSSESLAEINVLKYRIDRSFSTGELMNIVYRTLEITQAVK